EKAALLERQRHNRERCRCCDLRLSRFHPPFVLLL
ncbi:uncharacterized protein PgNI_07063, partial [Pyricularia grisea]|uniref:Uncharacterized protein n=1 Tax=Pyricularia grisea TaxID=148305 RepID=A0A6P8B193_PYRGI